MTSPSSGVLKSTFFATYKITNQIEKFIIYLRLDLEGHNCCHTPSQILALTNYQAICGLQEAHQRRV